jgi:hypothetical protein
LVPEKGGRKIRYRWQGWKLKILNIEIIIIGLSTFLRICSEQLDNGSSKINESYYSVNQQMQKHKLLYRFY